MSKDSISFLFSFYIFINAIGAIAYDNADRIHDQIIDIGDPVIEKLGHFDKKENNVPSGIVKNQ